MAINFKNYKANTRVNLQGSQIEKEEITLLTGAVKGTVVKSLEVINGNESSILNVIRKDISNITYATIKVDLKANDYLVLWEGFFLIPYGHTLCVSGDSNNITVVANVIEMA